MVDHIIAVDTYGSQRITDRASGQTLSAYKMGYTTAVTPILLALYGSKARDVSPRQASYRYLKIDGKVVVRHGYILLTLTADELASAERIARDHHRAGVFLWRDQRWWEFPTNRQGDYAEPLARSGPNFDPIVFRPTSPSTGERETAVEGIRAEKSQRSPNERPFWWLTGDTYPHRDLLKRQGARFSGKRRAWYYIGWELPAAIQQLLSEASPATQTPDRSEPETEHAPTMSPELERQILGVLAHDDAKAGLMLPQRQADSVVVAEPKLVVANETETIPEPQVEEKPPAVRVTKPTPLPSDGEPLDAVQSAIRDAKTLSPTREYKPAAVIGNGRLMRIGQSYCGELTGSISGQVYCYGYAIHNGICIYVNMGGPRTSVEAIRAKLSKGDVVTVVPDDAPAIELTPGEGNSGMYTDFLQTIPEARFTSLILLHDWVVNPNYGGAATTFILRVSEAQAKAKLKQHVAQLVNVPVFDIWIDFLWTVGQSAMLVRPTHSAGDIDLLTVVLDATAWTRLLTSGVEQNLIQLPEIH